MCGPMTQVPALLEAAASRLEARKKGRPAPADQSIFHDPNGQRIWDELRRLADLPKGPYDFLGSGTRGTAFGVGDRVMKITNDHTEAVAGALIRDTPDPKGNAYRVDSVWQLRGHEMSAYALVMERLQPLDAGDPWLKLADLWPSWSRKHDYAPIIPSVVSQFFIDAESQGHALVGDQNWLAFKKWMMELGKYLDDIGLFWHDFWHRNLLQRGSQHVAIDFGYSASTEDPEIEVISRAIRWR